MKCDVISLDNKKVGSVDLPDDVFAVDVRADILHRMVTWQLARRRAGTAHTKGRNDITGTGAKFGRQKGGGRARHGNKKVPQFRGGGKAHGPQARDFVPSLNKKVRKLALRCALSSKQADGKLVVLDKASLDDAKTKALATRFKALGWSSVLIVDGETLDDGFARAARNLINIDVLPSQGANVYDILRRDTLVLTQDAVEKLVERLK